MSVQTGLIGPLVIALLFSSPGRALSEDPCECLNWKQVYDSKRAVCGEALELYEKIKPAMNLTLMQATFIWKHLGVFDYYEYCKSFFHRMDNNYCVNVAMVEYGTEDFHGQQWCYVSDECQALNGGQRVSQKESYFFLGHVIAWLPNAISYPVMGFAEKYLHTPEPVRRDLSWKICSKGSDKRLRDMPPLEVLELAKSMDSIIGMVSKIAYLRLLPPTHTWDTIKDAVTAGDISGMPDLLQDAIAAKEPIVVDVDPEGHTHQRIVRGTEVYELEQRCTSTACGAKEWPFRRGRGVGEL